jgi:hypothetical protein
MSSLRPVKYALFQGSSETVSCTFAFSLFFPLGTYSCSSSCPNVLNYQAITVFRYRQLLPLNISQGIQSLATFSTFSRQTFIGP